MTKWVWTKFKIASIKLDVPKKSFPVIIKNDWKGFDMKCEICGNNLNSSQIIYDDTCCSMSCAAMKQRKTETGRMIFLSLEILKLDEEVVLKQEAREYLKSLYKKDSE